MAVHLHILLWAEMGYAFMEKIQDSFKKEELHVFFFLRSCLMKVWALSYSAQAPWCVLIAPCVMPFRTPPAPAGRQGQAPWPLLGVKQLYPAVRILKASCDL